MEVSYLTRRCRRGLCCTGFYAEDDGVYSRWGFVLHTIGFYAKTMAFVAVGFLSVGVFVGVGGHVRRGARPKQVFDSSVTRRVGNLSPRLVFDSGIT